MDKSGKAIVVLAVIFILVLSVACSTKNPEVRNDPSHPGIYLLKRTNLDGYYFYRIIDMEASVVCYVAGSSGMDCLPIDQTRLSISKE